MPTGTEKSVDPIIKNKVPRIAGKIPPSVMLFSGNFVIKSIDKAEYPFENI